MHPKDGLVLYINMMFINIMFTYDETLELCSTLNMFIIMVVTLNLYSVLNMLLTENITNYFK